MGESMGAMPVYNVGGTGNDGMFGGGGNGMWIFFLFFLLAWGGNGMFGGRNGAVDVPASKSDLCTEFNFNNLERSVGRIGQGICDSTYALNTTMLNGFNGIGSEIANSRFAADKCCCETNRNIDSLRYEAAKNTCDIVNAIRCDGDATRALITQNTIQELRDQLQAAQLTLANASQTQNLVNELRPCAKPAYITCSPYTVSGYGQGYGQGCGCGCGV